MPPGMIDSNTYEQIVNNDSNTYIIIDSVTALCYTLYSTVLLYYAPVAEGAKVSAIPAC